MLVAISRSHAISMTVPLLLRQRTEEGKWLVITACRLAGWLTLRIAFRVLRQVSKSENELYDLFTPYWVMGPGYVAVGMRGLCDRGHKRVCYALVNRENPTQRSAL